jgi:hypothetical protein
MPQKWILRATEAVPLPRVEFLDGVVNGAPHSPHL